MSSHGQSPTRPYQPPKVTTLRPTERGTVLLACTGDFDCEPIVRFPCCKPNPNACNGCQPP